MSKLTQTQKYQLLIKKVIEDETGAYAKKYGDRLVKKITWLVEQKQKRFDAVYGKGK